MRSARDERIRDHMPVGDHDTIRVDQKAATCDRPEILGFRRNYDDLDNAFIDVSSSRNRFSVQTQRIICAKGPKDSEDCDTQTKAGSAKAAHPMTNHIPSTPY
ncbi:hypothetical protein GCM10008941_11120 [Rhizomicrobium palustre]